MQAIFHPQQTYEAHQAKVAERRRSSIASYDDKLNTKLADSEATDEQMEGFRREKASWDRMTDKEKERWIEFEQRGGSFKNHDGGSVGMSAVARTV